MHKTMSDSKRDTRRAVKREQSVAHRSVSVIWDKCLQNSQVHVCVSVFLVTAMIQASKTDAASECLLVRNVSRVSCNQKNIWYYTSYEMKKKTLRDTIAEKQNRNIKISERRRKAEPEKKECDDDDTSAWTLREQPSLSAPTHIVIAKRQKRCTRFLCRLQSEAYKPDGGHLLWLL